jgi:hypothetical protein
MRIVALDRPLLGCRPNRAGIERLERSVPQRFHKAHLYTDVGALIGGE